MDYPKVGIGLIVRKGNKILMGRRLCEHAHGMWSCPGGHLEMWESFHDCALRELAEECGGDLNVTTPVLLDVANTTYMDEGKHYVNLLMVCDWIEGEPVNMEPDKLEKLDWYDWDSLPTPLMQGITHLIRNGINPMVEKQVYEFTNSDMLDEVIVYASVDNKDFFRAFESHKDRHTLTLTLDGVSLSPKPFFDMVQKKMDEIVKNGARQLLRETVDDAHLKLADAITEATNTIYERFNCGQSVSAD